MTDHRQGVKGNDHGISEESVVRIHYDNDIDHDEVDGLWSLDDSERRPLMTANSSDGSNSSSSSRTRAQGEREGGGLIAGFSNSHLSRDQSGSDHSLHTLQNKPFIQGHQVHADSSLSSSSSWMTRNGLHPRTWTRQTYLKAFLFLLLLTLVTLAFTVFRVQDHVKDILHYIDDHRNVGAVLFVSFYTIACWLFLPGSLFTIGAGFLFKPMPFALAIVILGDFLGALGTFLFGRYLFYDWVKGMIAKHPKFNALDEVIKDEGWKIVVMLRLTPIPFNLLTYFFSITSISLHTLLLGTVAGVFPGSCLGIWIGSMLQGLSGIDNVELEPKNVVILIMNGAFIVCSILTLSIFGKRSLRKAFSKLDHHQGLMTKQLDQDDIIVHDDHTTTIMEQNNSTDDLESGITTIVGEDSITDNENSDEDDTVDLKPSAAAEEISDASTTTGFTRGEKFMFMGIAALAIVNICVSIPLYFHFSHQQ